MSDARSFTYPGSPDNAPGSLRRIRESGPVRLDVGCEIEETQLLAQNLRRLVTGQDHVIEALICSYARFLSGLRDPSRPLFTGLLLGPTGVGKTATCEAIAETLFGSERAMTRINAEEYTHGHEISKLLGAPPGYVGQHLEPLLSQARIDEPHRRLREETGPGIGDEPPLVDRIFPVEANKFHSLILFDEIEKAHPVVWNALLGILEDGRLTLGNNTTTDFTRSIILMTSNVGSREMSALLERRPVGFDRADEMEPQDAEASLEQTALSAARATFPLEFLNRFDETLVYSALTPEDLERILDKFLSEVHIRAIKQAGVPLLLKLTGEARRYLIDKGSDLRYGARPLRRAVERELVDPVSRLIAARSVRPGDVVEVRREGDRLAFYRQSRSVTGVVA